MSRTCLLCGEAGRWPIPHQQIPVVDAILAERAAPAYAWYMCRRCATGYQDPPSDPDVLHRMWVDSDTVSEAATAARRRSATLLWAIFEPHLPRVGRALDLGCGHGWLMREFASRGWQVRGIDVDAKTLASHHDLGLDTTIAPLEDADLDAGLDVVSCTYAINFVRDPLALLRRIRAALAPDGRFLLAFTDLFTCLDRLLPSYGMAWLPNADGVAWACAAAGLQPILVQRRRGTVLIVARAVDPDPAPPRIAAWRWRTWLRSKRLRHALCGRPAQIVVRSVKRIVCR